MAHINTVSIDPDTDDVRVVNSSDDTASAHTDPASSSNGTASPASSNSPEVRDRFPKRNKKPFQEDITPDPPSGAASRDTEEEDYPEPNLDLNKSPSIIPMSTTPGQHRRRNQGKMTEVEEPQIEMRSRFSNSQPFDPTVDPPKRGAASSSETPATANKKVKGSFQFDPNSCIYYANACCELLHYRVAAIVVGVLEILMIGGWAAFAWYFYTQIGLGIASYAAIGAQALIALLGLASIGLMFVGVLTEKAWLLWPHMVFQILGIGIGIVLTVIAVVSMAAGTSIAETVFGRIFGPNNLPLVESALGPIWPFCLAVIFDFGAAIGIWFYILIRGAYDYLLDKKFFERYTASQALATNRVVEERLSKLAPPDPSNSNGERSQTTRT